MNDSPAMDRLRAEITDMQDAAASAAALITSLSAQLRDALARANAAGDDSALTELADSLDRQSQALAAAVVANTPADPMAATGEPQPATAGGDVNPDTAPMMSGAVAPAAHATSPAAGPADGPVNTNPAEPTNLGHGTIGSSAGNTPVENLPAALQPGDDAPTPVETPVVADGLDPTARSPNPSATTDNFPDADPAANHIDPDTGQPVVSPPGVDPGTGAAIPTTEAIPVDVVRDETTDAMDAETTDGSADNPQPVDVVRDETTEAPTPAPPFEGTESSVPVIDPATGQPVQLDPVTSAPITDAPADTSDATSGGPAPGPVDSPAAPL